MQVNPLRGICRSKSHRLQSRPAVRDRKLGDESELRAQAREAMKAGRLPEHPPERMWGGPGSGASCAVCGKTVGKKEVEFELQFTSDGGPAPVNYHVHARCFAAWELERRNGPPQGRSLRQEGDARIMPCRERNAKKRGERG